MKGATQRSVMLRGPALSLRSRRSSARPHTSQGYAERSGPLCPEGASHYRTLAFISKVFQLAYSLPPTVADVCSVSRYCVGLCFCRAHVANVKQRQIDAKCCRKITILTMAGNIYRWTFPLVSRCASYPTAVPNTERKPSLQEHWIKCQWFHTQTLLCE